MIILDWFVIELTIEMREPSKVVHSQMGLLCSVSLSLCLIFFVLFFVFFFFFVIVSQTFFFCLDKFEQYGLIILFYFIFNVVFFSQSHFNFTTFSYFILIYFYFYLFSLSILVSIWVLNPWNLGCDRLVLEQLDFKLYRFFLRIKSRISLWLSSMTRLSATK